MYDKRMNKEEFFDAIKTTSLLALVAALLIGCTFTVVTPKFKDRYEVISPIIHSEY